MCGKDRSGGMTIGSSVPSSISSGADLSNNASVSVAKKVLDSIKQQGDEAVALIDSAGSGSTTLGTQLNTKA